MVLGAYRMIERGRQFIVGDKAYPMPLTLDQIGSYAQHFTPPLPFTDFARVVMAIDDEYRNGE